MMVKCKNEIMPDDLNLHSKLLDLLNMIWPFVKNQRCDDDLISFLDFRKCGWSNRSLKCKEMSTLQQHYLSLSIKGISIIIFSISCHFEPFEDT